MLLWTSAKTKTVKRLGQVKQNEAWTGRYWLEIITVAQKSEPTRRGLGMTHLVTILEAAGNAARFPTVAVLGLHDRRHVTGRLVFRDRQPAGALTGKTTGDGAIRFHTHDPQPGLTVVFVLQEWGEGKTVRDGVTNARLLSGKRKKAILHQLRFGYDMKHPGTQRQKWNYRTAKLKLPTGSFYVRVVFNSKS